MKTMYKEMNTLCFIVHAALPVTLFAQPHQPVELAPMETTSGVVFRCRAPNSDRVYLAGDFNQWANNVNGVIRDEAFAMSGPDEYGIFSKTVSLLPGVYRYKFAVVGNEYQGWFVPEYTPIKDEGENAFIIVDGIADGPDRIRIAQAPQKGPEGITFELHAPDAYIVYLAGTFNQWAENNQGRVHNLRYAMKGPDPFGIWRVTIPLGAGHYEYQFVINGREWIKNPLAVLQYNGERSALEVR